ncbi:TPA: hypothetical protein ACGO0C_000510 [Streptococcus suis]
MKTRSKILQRLKTIESISQKSITYTAKPIFNDDYSIKYWRVSAPDFDKTFSEDAFYEWSQGKVVEINFEDVSTEVLRGFMHSGN